VGCLLDYNSEYSVIDSSIANGIKNTRVRIFQDWYGYLLNDEWSRCDKCSAMLLQTLPKESKERVNLERFVCFIDDQAVKERSALDEKIKLEHRPFMREQLKITEPDKIEYWRANEIRDEFMNVFTSNHLIE